MEFPYKNGKICIYSEKRPKYAFALLKMHNIPKLNIQIYKYARLYKASNYKDEDIII